MQNKRNVLIISDGDDMAGVNFAIKKAFDKFSDRYILRQVRGTDNYIKYPHDITWWGSNELVNRLYDSADLIHISEYPWALLGGSAPKIWKLVPKPTVIHQHGTPFRNNPRQFLDIAKREHSTQIVSTVDLLVDDSLEWLPNPVDIEMMLAIRLQNYKNDGIIRLGQAPTNRQEKHTAEYIAVAKELGVDYLVVESQTWETTLKEKARTDIWFDQLTYGYGNNAIEAAGMGIPVVGGFANDVHKQRYVDLVGELPFVEATVGTLREVFRRLIEDRDFRLSESDRIHSIVRDLHGEASVVKRLEAIYDRTINEFEILH